MQFEKDVNICSSDLWYDLVEGYMNPFLMLVSEDEAIAVLNATKLIEEFFNAAISNGIIELG